MCVIRKFANSDKNWARYFFSSNFFVLKRKKIIFPILKPAKIIFYHALAKRRNLCQLSQNYVISSYRDPGCQQNLACTRTTGEGIRFAKKNWQHILRSTSCDSFAFNDVANSLDIRTEWCCDRRFFSLEVRFVAQRDGGECLTCSKYVWSTWECHDSCISVVEGGGEYF